MLTDEEIMDIRNRAKLNDNRQINPMFFARDIERAVMAKAMPIHKQEPVGKICKSAECGGVDFYFDKIPDGETMLYAEPVTIPKQEPVALCHHADFNRLHEGMHVVIKPAGTKTTDKHVPLYAEPQPAQAVMPDGYEIKIDEDGLVQILDHGSKTAELVRQPIVIRYFTDLLSASPKPE